MIYYIDQFGRYTGKHEDRDIGFYNELGLIPRHITDVEPPERRPGFELVFKGDKWVHWPVSEEIQDDIQ